MLTAVVLCRNEASRLPRCLDSLRFCDHVYVIDDNSTDNSAQIGASAGAQIVLHPLNGSFSSQRNFALSLISSGWVLFVDADEVVTPDLAREIRQNIGLGFSGFYLPRLDILWNHRFKYGDLNGFKILRLAKKDAGEWTGAVHETWKISGPVGTLNQPLYHYPHQTLYQFLHSLNSYSSLRAKELYNQKKTAGIWQVIFCPWGKFLYLYFFRLGFMDRLPGFLHALCMSFYTFLVRGKLYLLYRGIGEYA